MSARIEVAYCSACRAAISRISGDAWRHNVPPREEHEAKADRKSIRDLMALTTLKRSS